MLARHWRVVFLAKVKLGTSLEDALAFADAAVIAYDERHSPTARWRPAWARTGLLADDRAALVHAFEALVTHVRAERLKGQSRCHCDLCARHCAVVSELESKARGRIRQRRRAS